MIEKTIEIADAGLRFHILKTDKFKMSRLSLNFILPADVERSPVTRLMLATMMRGCERYPSVVAINRRLDELYGATVTTRATSVGERHVFRISSEFLSDRFRFDGDGESVALSVCDVIMEILFRPILDDKGLLSESNFKSEKKLAVDSVKALINDPKAYAAKKCSKLTFGDDPMGISTTGNVKQIESITLEAVSENIAYFLKNSVIECYYVGADDVNDVISLISERFATLGRDKVVLKGKERALKRDVNAPIKTLEESLNVSQARLNIGLVCDTVMRDRDYYAMSVFNEIFGASSVSKLFINVREKQSLCYYCYSSLSSATGTMQIMCGIKSENREKAYTEIENQLQAMQRGAFDDDDIETAKRTMISGILQTLDSPAAITAFKFRRFLADVEESVEEAIERINSVSRDEIIKVANKVRFDCVYFLSGNEEEDEWEDE